MPELQTSSAAYPDQGLRLARNYSTRRHRQNKATAGHYDLPTSTSPHAALPKSQRCPSRGSVINSN